MDYSNYTSDIVISMLEDPRHTEFSGVLDYSITRRDLWLSLNSLNESRKTGILNNGLNQWGTKIRPNKLAQLVYCLSKVAVLTVDLNKYKEAFLNASANVWNADSVVYLEDSFAQAAMGLADVPSSNTYNGSTGDPFLPIEGDDENDLDLLYDDVEWSLEVLSDDGEDTYTKVLKVFHLLGDLEQNICYFRETQSVRGLRFGIGFMQKKPIVFKYFYKKKQLFRLYEIKIIRHFRLLSLQNGIIAAKP